MKKGLTEIVFILDRSGSMSGLESDTIGGFNSMLDRQKAEAGEAMISTVLFDDRTEILHDRLVMKNVEHMTEKEYFVRGCTALLDAVGGVVHHINTIHKYAREEDRPEKTLFIIITDGLENSSRQYTYEKVKSMIEEQKREHGWEFLFLGANIDAIKVAGQFGIHENNAVNFECDSEGTQLNYEVLSNVVSQVRMASPQCGISPLWKKKIEKDYAKRHKAR